MYLKEIWRYPAKSMAGEKLQQVELTSLGIEGDREILVRAATGRILTARTHPKLLGFKSTIGDNNIVLIDGLEWSAPEVRERISDTLKQPVKLIRHNGPERFDILPLLVATDGAIEHMRMDGRRLRPNLVIGGVEGLEERRWPGRRLRIGDALVAPAQLRGRCVMTTFEPDTLVQDLGVLKRIVHQLDGVMGLDTAVVDGANLKEGDPVAIFD
jgi:uncharacterized protein